METSDETLATAAALGDRAAFSALVTRHYDRVFGLAWRLTGSRFEAQDLAQDVCAAAKVMKNFSTEFKMPTMKAGVLDGNLLTVDGIKSLADLPSREVLLAQLLGVLQAPASKLVRTLAEPAASLARVIKAKGEKA